jgi:hypothetical protein
VAEEEEEEETPRISFEMDRRRNSKLEGWRDCVTTLLVCSFRATSMHFVEGEKEAPCVALGKRSNMVLGLSS